MKGIERTYAFLSDGAGDGRAFHFTLRVDDDTSVVLASCTKDEDTLQRIICTHLEVEEDTVPTAPRLALADNDSGHGYSK